LLYSKVLDKTIQNVTLKAAKDTKI